MAAVAQSSATLQGTRSLSHSSPSLSSLSSSASQSSLSPRINLTPSPSHTRSTTQKRAPLPISAIARRAQGPSGGDTSVHRLLDENKFLILPGIYDALSAVIVQKSGFDAGFISGYATSASLLGKPDFGLLTPTEMCTTARYVCSAAPTIPIIVDADTGGGNALNVQRTVRDLIAAGAAGCFLEDQVWPKKCGHMRGKQVIPAEEHAVKIRAARDAIGDADFFLVARTDARATSAKTGLEEAIHRANLYMEAGADASFVEAPRTVEEMREIGQRTKGPRVCNMLEGGATPLLTPDELADLGFTIIVNPLTGLYASTKALTGIYRDLKEKGTTRGSLDKLATWSEFSDLVELESWFASEAKYSPKELASTGSK